MKKKEKELELSYDEAMKELESIVKKLQGSSNKLEDDISLYERGMELSKACKEKLEKAKLHVEYLNDLEESQ